MAATNTATTWADDEGYEDTYVDSNEAEWDRVKPVTTYEKDENGARVEIIKKIRTFRIDRPVAPADLRKELKVFGKAKAVEEKDSKDSIVSKEPPMALELGSADKHERESRSELKRFLSENVPDDSRPLAAKEDAAAKEAEAKSGTWGTNRTSAVKHASSGDVKRKVRVCNVSDDITEENLYNIFSANGAEVERVFLATDKDTGNNRGYAFVTFRDERYVDEAVRQRRFNFKNVVLTVSPAMDKKA